MRAAEQRRPRAPRALPWLVLGAHLLALFLVGQALRPREREAGAPPPQPLWLRLLPDRAPQPEPPARPAPPGRKTPPPPSPAPPELARPRAPAPVAEAITVPPAEAPVAARPPEPPASTPLDLRLPPAVHRAPPAAAQARDDPRANTPRPGSEDRMARALGTDQTLRESVMSDGTRQFRRGSGCVSARPAREGQINPFNQSTSPTPRVIDGC